MKRPLLAFFLPFIPIIFYTIIIKNYGYQEDIDFGRNRNYDYFYKEYGSNKIQIEQNLVDINFLNTELKIHNKVLDNFYKIFVKILDDNELYDWCTDCNITTYNFKYINGETNLSPHAFGIAIDFMHTNMYSGENGYVYWKWSYSNIMGKKELYCTPPKKLIKLFKKYDFIWGGDWYHYDTVHFEYRPELFK